MHPLITHVFQGSRSESDSGITVCEIGRIGVPFLDDAATLTSSLCWLTIIGTCFIFFWGGVVVLRIILIRDYDVYICVPQFLKRAILDCSSC